MAEIDRYRPDDRRQVEALYRRVFGPDAAEANRLRWDWQYRRNPHVPPDGPLIWVAREGTTIVGQYATMPVRCPVNGPRDRRRRGAWTSWSRPNGSGRASATCSSARGIATSGASLGLGLVRVVVPAVPEDALAGRRPGAVPRQAAQPPRAAPAELAGGRQPPRVVRHAAVDPPRGAVAAAAGRSRGHPPLRRELHAPLGARAAALRRSPCGATRPYLNWKYIQAPHVRYHMAALKRDGEAAGYVVYRHVQEPRGRVTLLVDFLADPDDEAGLLTLLRWVDREARAADSDKIRTFAMHEGFRKLLRQSGYYSVKSTMEFVAKVNAAVVPAGFYDDDRQLARHARRFRSGSMTR